MKKLIITKRRVFFHNIELIGGDLFLVQLVPVGYAIGISETNKFQFTALLLLCVANPTPLRFGDK